MQASSSSLEDQIVGVWEFGSYVTENTDGSEREHPLGEHARGLIMYTPDGRMSVQISASGRPPYADGALHGGTDEERATAAAGYLAYAGSYRVVDDVVTHLPLVSLFPNWEGAEVPRRAHIEHDTLTLDLLQPIRQDDRLRNGRLEWHRATAL